MAINDDNMKQVYNALVNKFGSDYVGSYDEYINSMQDEENRKIAYDALSDYDTGTFEYFNEQLGFVKANDVKNPVAVAENNAQNNMGVADQLETPAAGTAAPSATMQGDSLSANMMGAAHASTNAAPASTQTAQQQQDENRTPSNYRDFYSMVTDMRNAMQPDIVEDDDLYSVTKGAENLKKYGQTKDANTMQLVDGGMTYNDELILRDLHDRCVEYSNNQELAMEYKQKAVELLGEGGVEKFERYVKQEFVDQRREEINERQQQINKQIGEITGIDMDLPFGIADTWRNTIATYMRLKGDSSNGIFKYLGAPAYLADKAVQAIMPDELRNKVDQLYNLALMQKENENSLEILDEFEKEQAENLSEQQEDNALIYCMKWVNNYRRRVWAGALDVMDDMATYDFGISDMNKMSHLLKINEKAERGEELTEDELALLNAYATNAAIAANCELSMSYGAGQVTGYSMPLMIEMMANPLAGTGKAVSSRVAANLSKYAARSATSKLIAKTLTAGSRVVGDVAGAAGMAMTSGLPKVLANADERMLGDIQFKFEDDGSISFDKYENGEESYYIAFLKSLGASTIEYQSEMFGEYFKPILKPLNKAVAGGVYKLNKEWFKNGYRVLMNVDKLAAKSQLQGWVPETMEEIVGGIENAIFVGDENLFTTYNEDGSVDKRGVLDWGNIFETGMDMLPMQMAFGMLGLGISGARKSKMMYNSARNVSKAQAKLSAELRDNMLAIVNNAIDHNNDNGQLGAALKQIADEYEMNQDQQIVMANYVAARMMDKGIKMADNFDKLNNVEQLVYGAAYKQGWNMDGKDVNYAVTMANNCRKKLTDNEKTRQLAEMIEQDPVKAIAWMHDNNSSELGGEYFSEQQMRDAENYASAFMTVRGAADKMSLEFDNRMDNNEAIARKSAHKDGMIHPVTLFDGTVVYVTKGTIVAGEEGYPDLKKCDPQVVVYDPVQQKKRLLNRAQIDMVGELQDPQKQLDEMRAAIEQEKNMAWNALVNGEINAKPGDEMDIMVNGQPQHVAVAMVYTSAEGMPMVQYAMEDGTVVDEPMAELKKKRDTFTDTTAYIESEFNAQLDEEQQRREYDAVAERAAAAQQEEAPATEAPAEERMVWMSNGEQHVGTTAGYDKYGNVVMNDETTGRQVALTDEEAETLEYAAIETKPTEQAEVVEEKTAPAEEESSMPFKADAEGNPTTDNEPAMVGKALYEDKTLSRKDNSDYIDGQVQNAIAAKQAEDKWTMPTGLSRNQMIEQKQQHEKRMAEADKAVAFWTAVRSAFAENIKEEEQAAVHAANMEEARKAAEAEAARKAAVEAEERAKAEQAARLAEIEAKAKRTIPIDTKVPAANFLQTLKRKFTGEDDKVNWGELKNAIDKNIGEYVGDLRKNKMDKVAYDSMKYWEAVRKEFVQAYKKAQDEELKEWRKAQNEKAKAERENMTQFDKVENKRRRMNPSERANVVKNRLDNQPTTPYMAVLFEFTQAGGLGLDSDDVKRQLGVQNPWKEGFAPQLAKNGRGIERAAEDIAAYYGGLFDEGEVRDAIIEILGNVGTKKRAAEQLEALVDENFESKRERAEAYKSMYGIDYSDKDTEEEAQEYENYAVEVEDVPEELREVDDIPFSMADEGRSRVVNQNVTWSKLAKVAKLFGFKLNNLNAEGIRGMYSNGAIYLNRTYIMNPENHVSLGWVFGHELLHAMKEKSMEQYKMMRIACILMLGKNEYKRRVMHTLALYKNAVEKEKQHRMENNVPENVPYKFHELTIEEAEEEVIADFAGYLLENGKMLDKFVAKFEQKEEYKGMLQTIADFVAEAWDKVKDIFGLNSKEISNLDYACNVLFDMMNETNQGKVADAGLMDDALNEEEISNSKKSIVTDPALIEKLEASEKVTGYRTVVLNEDGTFGSPMASGLRSAGKKQEKTTSFELNKWEQSDEHAELADENGKIDLVKPDGKTVGKVDYNPYIHNRLTKVNKQFKQAWERPNLVYIKTEIPTNELESGYRAEKANKSVGIHNWPSKRSKEKLVLSRYDKPVEIVSWEEVADDWEKEFKDSGVNFDIVPPAMLDILAARGVEILPPHKGMGKECFAAYERWKEKNGKVKFSIVIGDKKDDNGHRFYERNGSVNLWNLDKLFEEAMREPAPIRLTDFNVNHILESHGKEFGGNADLILNFIEDVMDNAKILRMANGSSMYVVLTGDNIDKQAIIRLYPSKDGSYYNVETAGYRSRWRNDEKIIAELSAPTQNEAVSNSDDPHNQLKFGTERFIANGTKSSIGKDRENGADFQIIGEETDKNGHKYSISDIYGDNFKRWFGDWENDPENASKVVDAEGKPLVVYHGTTSAGKDGKPFSIFEPKAQKGGTGKEFYFFDKESHASAFSGGGVVRFDDPMELYNKMLGYTREQIREFYSRLEEQGEEPADVIPNISFNELVSAAKKIVRPYGSETIEDWLYGYDDSAWGKFRLLQSIYHDARFESQRDRKDGGIYKCYLDIKNPLIVDAKNNAWNSFYFNGEKTNMPELVEYAIANGYDGMIVKNVFELTHMPGRTISNDYIVFSPNQIKSATDNNGEYDKNNPDIRYSLVDTHEDMGDGNAIDVKDGEVKFSIAAEKMPENKKLVNALANTFKGSWAEGEMQKLLDDTNDVFETVQPLMDMHPDFMMAQGRTIALNKNGMPIYNVFFANKDTQAPTIEFSTNCVKKEAMNMLMDALKKSGVLHLVNESNLDDVFELLKKHGYDIPCKMCYVESKRNILHLKYEFADKWNNVADAAGLDKVAKITDGVDVQLDEQQIKKLEKVVADNGASTVPGRIAKMMLEYPSLRARFDAEDMMTISGNERMLDLFNDTPLMGLMASYAGAATAKPTFASHPYDQRMFNEKYGVMRPYFGEAGIEYGGFRSRSFSDADPNLFPDEIQVRRNLAITKSGMYGYTKVPYMVDLFGETGEFINMSLVVDIDNGNEKVTKKNIKGSDQYKYAGLINVGDKRHQQALDMTDEEYEQYKNEYGLKDGDWDYYFSSESFPVKKALMFRKEERFGGRVGTIIVSVSDEMTRMALRDSRIDQVIPYHASQKSIESKNKTNYLFAKDYTREQETIGNKNAKIKTYIPSMDIYAPVYYNVEGGYTDFNFNEACQLFGDAKKAAAVYKEWCAENGFTPKYPEFADEENYYKLLADFRRYDNSGNALVQGAVEMKLPKNWAEKLDGYLTERENTTQQNNDMVNNEPFMNDLRDMLGIKRGKDQLKADPYPLADRGGQATDIVRGKDTDNFGTDQKNRQKFSIEDVNLLEEIDDRYENEGKMTAQDYAEEVMSLAEENEELAKMLQPIVERYQQDMADYIESGKRMETDGSEQLVESVKRLIENKRFEANGEKYSLATAGTYFSGGGLVEYALSELLDKKFAVEYDKKIAGVYANNHGDHIINADVTDILSGALGWANGHVNYFHASPVCHNFSNAKHGKKEEEIDIRTAEATAQAIDWMLPEVVTIENVSDYKNSESITKITDALDKNGYKYDVDVYDSANYGDATSRKRLILRAVKNGELPAKPQYKAKVSWHDVTKDLLQDLPKATMSAGSEEAIVKSIPNWKELDEPILVMNEQHGNARVAMMNEPAPTITANGAGEEYVVLPGGDVRRCTIELLKRITGLKDDYKLDVSDKLAHTIIGNGIPVNMSKAVMGSLIEHAMKQRKERENVTSHIDAAYKHAVETGDMKEAENLFQQYVLKQADERIVPILFGENYSTLDHSHVAKMLKEKNSLALKHAVKVMKGLVPKNAVLIPMPNHFGYADDTLVLANALGRATKTKVIDALQGIERMSSKVAKDSNKKLKPQELGLSLKVELPKGKIPVIVDNVVASGVTAAAAIQATGGGVMLAYAKSNRAKKVALLKRADVATYDSEGKLIPLSKRFDVTTSNEKYSIPDADVNETGSWSRENILLRDEIYNAEGSLSKDISTKISDMLDTMLPYTASKRSRAGLHIYSGGQRDFFTWTGDKNAVIGYKKGTWVDSDRISPNGEELLEKTITIDEEEKHYKKLVNVSDGVRAIDVLKEQRDILVPMLEKQIDKYESWKAGYSRNPYALSMIQYQIDHLRGRINQLNYMADEKNKGFYNPHLDREVTKFSIAEPKFRREWSDGSNIFFSNALRAAEAVKQDKATPDQWLKMIQNGGGLKAGEDKWIGLTEWIDEKKQAGVKTLTKEEVIDYIAENQIVVEEVHYAEKSTVYEEWLRDIENALQAKYDEIASIKSKNYALDVLNKEFGNNVTDGYAFWADEGSIEIDREKPISRHLAIAEKLGMPKPNLIDKNIDSVRLQYTTYALSNNKEIALVVPTIESWKEDDNIHFGDAGNGRAVAWIRFGETKDVEGKRVLVIDEIQSKRHQEGREKGYALTKNEAEKRSADAKEKAEEANAERENIINKIEKEVLTSLDDEAEIDIAKYIIRCLRLENSFDESVAYCYNLISDHPEETIGWTDSKINRLRDIFENAGEIPNVKSQFDFENTNSGIVPNAPFEKNWMELCMKRMIRYAAENGYDQLAWTTGTQQSERYDISKFVDSVNVDKYTESGECSVKLISKDGDDISHIGFKKGGEILFCNEDHSFIGKNLSEVVGKELAEKILDTAETGGIVKPAEDIEFGGKGMKAFYDKMIPSFVQKYAKKWGANVGETADLWKLTKEMQKMWKVDITEEMKKSVLEGQPLFRMLNGENYDHAPAEVERIKAKVAEMEERFGVKLQVRNSIDEVVNPFAKAEIEKQEAARKAGKKWGAAKAWYDSETGMVEIYLPYAESLEDVEKTILHEVVGHKGLREMLSESESEWINKLMDIYELLPDYAKRQIMDDAHKNGYNIAVAVDEYLADQAMEEYTPTWWGRVAAYISNLLRNIGIDVELNENDVKYMLWRSRKTLENKGNDSVVDKAETASMRWMNGIGQYMDAEKLTKNVPNFRFVGQVAEHYLNSNNIKVAYLMNKVGYTAEQIKMATGCEMGADGQWRMEKQDNYSNAPKKNPYNPYLENNEGMDNVVTIKDIVAAEGKKLLKEYPGIGDVTITFVNEPNKKWVGKTHGKFIYVNEPRLHSEMQSWNIEENEENYNLELEKVIAHEVQHLIQNIEGFSQGGSTTLSENIAMYYFDKATDEIKAMALTLSDEMLNELAEEQADMDELEQLLMNRINNNPGTKLEEISRLVFDMLVSSDLKDIADMAKHAIDTGRWLSMPPIEIYHSLIGEVEARNVMKRYGWTAEKMLHTLGVTTEDVARDEQIDLTKEMAVNISKQMAAEKGENAETGAKYSIVDEFEDPEVLMRKQMEDEINRLNNEVASLRKKLAKNSDIEEAKQQAIKTLRENIDTNVGQVMNSLEIRQLINMVENAKSAKKLDDALDRVAAVLQKANLRYETMRLDKLLKTRLRVTDTKGVAVGKVVDSKTNERIQALKTAFKQLLLTNIDDELRQMRSQKLAFGRQLRDAATPATDKVAIEQMLEELNQRIDAALEERDNLRKTTTAETSEQLEERKAKIDDLIMRDPENVSDAMREELLVIEYKQKAVEIQKGRQEMANREYNAKEYERLAESARDKNEKARLLTEAELEYAAYMQAQRKLMEQTRELADTIKELLDEGQDKFAARKQAQLDKQRELQLIARHAVRNWRELSPNTPEAELSEKEKKHKEFQKSWRRKFVDWLMEPLNSFDFVLQAMAMNNLPGGGDLYHILMTGEEGVIAAHDRRTDGIKAQREEIDNRIAEIFGEGYNLEKLLEESNDKKELIKCRHMHDTSDHLAGDEKLLDMTKGEMLYAWLAWRQEDARKKMEAVGWTSASIEQIEETLGEKYIEFGTWLTEDYLPKTREERYNPVHVEVFGTNMAKTQHYFPLRYQKRDISRKAGLDDMQRVNDTGTIPGNIVERVVHTHRLDTQQNAFGVLMKYIDDMETWAALTPAYANINILLKDKHFMNALDDNHQGLSEVFRQAAQVATMTYRAPKQSEFNNFIAKIQRLWAGSKISWRFFTAMKQLFSYSVFRGYSLDRQFQFELLKNEPFMPQNMKKNYDWAKDNLPGFRDRIDKGSAGLEILEREGFDLGAAVNKFTNMGMLPNQTIDAITVACGARCVYNLEKRKLMKMGMKEEEAHKLAVRMAEIAFNRSQQSSNPAFLSPKQKSKNVVDVASTAFQNSNIGFTRAAILGYVMMKRSEKYSPEWKQGLNMLIANTAIAQGGWTLGGAMFTWGTRLALNAFTMMFGDDDDDEYVDVFGSELLLSILTSVAIAPVRGTTPGNFLDAILNSHDFDLLSGMSEMLNFFKDINKSFSKIMDEEAEDKDGNELTPMGRAWEAAYEIGSRIGKIATNAIGINQETYVNMVLGCWDAIEKGRFDLIDFMLIINAPRSSRIDVVKALNHDNDDAADFAEKMSVALGIYDEEKTVRGSRYFPTTKPLTEKRED